MTRETEAKVIFWAILAAVFVLLVTFVLPAHSQTGGKEVVKAAPIDLCTIWITVIVIRLGALIEQGKKEETK